MKLRLLSFALCTIFGLYGSQDPQESMELGKALQDTKKVNLVLYFHSIEPVVERDKRTIEQFRQDEKRRIMDYRIMDYIVTNEKMWKYVKGDPWMDYSRNIDTLANTDMCYAGCDQGLVLYYIMPNAKKNC